MSLIAIAWRSLTQRALASTLTGLSMALGVALVVMVLVAYHVISDSFQRGAGGGYDVIVGAKGGKLQLVLNTVYHLSTPVENIPYSVFHDLNEGRFKPYVTRAIPYCLGDNYEGQRVVATVPDLFAETQYAPGRKYAFSAGRNFQSSGFFEGVIGALAASRTGLKVGDTFRPTHGVNDDGQGHEHDAFKVVGILEPTGTPNDRALFINIEGFYLLENHAKPVGETNPADPKAKVDVASGHEEHEATHKHHEGEAEHEHEGHEHSHTPLPEDQRELTAVLVRTSSPAASIQLPNLINEGSAAQAVMPVREIRGLFDVIVGPIETVLLALTGLIVVVSGVGILVSIYNSMSERRREIAVMRALGARRSTVRTIVLLESMLLSLTGGLAGWILGRALIAALSPAIAARTGVVIGFAPLIPAELALVPALIVLSALAGYLPAMTAYRTDVAKALASAP
ncbi:ABC transporter permease [Singulisphaera acidiphila]|uniref:ABC-type transport system, involved in lipoprotein release, permease component n=1 Tax=Singulisphaera acidiphila (strain ATCC BAA-1392 / DSM 18658 / VKM B-2454 / MOB10) TaxID=886293 RepID=L0DJI7_SINAD|nr:ABC transporter permease [Singulisphaera acidiphila]AGA29010.1 ABC-type transport system, involved in lipoprotein release, permease component [Singulisphaera acidiphila DSM 18658]